MFFSIDPRNGIAIYEQIVRQVKFAVADGVLIPGQLLPSVRALSVQLAVNPNTVAKAFQLLQSEGITESMRGRGLAICTDAVVVCKQARRALLEERVRSAISEALHGGLSTKEVRRLMLEQLDRLDGNVATVGSAMTDTEPA